MFRLSITLFLLAILAAVFGFGGIAESAVGAAKIVFYIAIILFIISLIMGGYKRS